MESSHIVSKSFLSRNNGDNFIYDDIMIENIVVFKSLKCTYLYVRPDLIDVHNKL